MTTTTRPRAAAGAHAGNGPQEHSEWRHGPVAAAANASILTLLAAIVIRLSGLAPIWPLVVAVLMAGALVAAGRMRKPRALALRSLVYRSTAALTVGVWLFVMTADFSRVGAGALTGLILTGTALAAAVVTIGGLRTGRPGLGLLATLVTILAGIPGGIIVYVTDVLTIFTTTEGVTRATYPSWLSTAAMTVAVLAALFAVFGRVCANHEIAEDEALAQALMLKAHGREMALMQQLLRTELNVPGLRVTDFKSWDNGAGETYTVDGVADGIGHADIASHANSLASRLDLLNGCGVEGVPGETRGRFHVEVSRVNKIKEKRDYPSTYVQRSIYNPVPVGFLRPGTEVGIGMRESSVFCFGQKRSGKTTTLYDIAAGILQCTDAMLWVIDFGGGGVALPFLYPYAEGVVDTPAVDWVATTIPEAKRMAELAFAIATDRKTFYKHRKRKKNTNLLPLDAEVPEIIIMIDEGAEAMGENAGMSYEAKEVRTILEAIVRVAGDSGVNMVFSGLAATAEVIDRMTLAQMAIRIGMRVTDHRELSYGFNQDYGMDPADIPYQGSGFIKTDHESPTRVFKAYLLEPAQMYDIAVATASWRPELDARGRALGGEMYEKRWERTKHLLTDEHGNVLIDPTTGGLAATATAVLDPPQLPAPAPAIGGGPLPANFDLAAAGRGPIDPTAPPPAPPGAGGDVPDGARPFEVQGSVQDWMDRADQSAADLERAAAAAGPADDDDDGADDPRVRAFREQLNAGIDWSKPESWPTMPTPPGIEAQQNPQGSAVLEALVRHHGPDGILKKDILVKLKLGGPWGPPVNVSDQAVADWLKPGPAGRKQPAPWLADRPVRAAYVHRSWNPPGAAVA